MSVLGSLPWLSGGLGRKGYSKMMSLIIISLWKPMLFPRILPHLASLSALASDWRRIS